MAQTFYVAKDGQELGPWTLAEIEQRLESQELDIDDYVFDEGKKDWVPLSGWLKANESKVVPSKKLGFWTNPYPDAPKVPTPKAKESSPRPAPPAEESPAKPSRPALHVEPAAPTIQRQVAFKNGVGILHVKPEHAGSIALEIKTISDSKLQPPPQLVVNVRPGEATELRLSCVASVRAGETADLHIIAVDTFGNIADDFQGTVEIVEKLINVRTHSVELRGGRGSVSLTPTIVGSYSLGCEPLKTGLKVKHPLSLEVRSGPAVKVVAESPADSRAGEDVPITLRAVDAYGNTVTDYQSEQSLKIEFTPAKKAS